MYKQTEAIAISQYLLDQTVGAQRGLAPLRPKVGDTIYWYCNEDGRVHSAEVQFVNVAKAGDIYIEVNYEVEEECNGVTKTLFIDDDEAMEKDFS